MSEVGEQLTGKISLKLDSSTLLLEDGRKYKVQDSKQKQKIYVIGKAS